MCIYSSLRNLIHKCIRLQINEVLTFMAKACREHRYLGSDVTSPETDEGGTKRFGEQDGSEIRWRGGRYRVRAAG